MNWSVGFISGVMAGLEFFEDDEIGSVFMILDIVIIRFIFEWETSK